MLLGLVMKVSTFLRLSAAPRAVVACLVVFFVRSHDAFVVVEPMTTRAAAADPFSPSSSTRNVNELRRRRRHDVQPRRHHASQQLSIRHGFFKDMLDKAFENDSNLPQDDKRTGQLDDSSSEDEDFGGIIGRDVSSFPSSSSSRRTLTETQQKWRRLQMSSIPRLENSAVEMDLFLTGVPNKDPSNDLFGSRVNVSSRDRRVGLAVPDQPTVSSVRVEFSKDNKCRCVTDSAFTSSASSEDESGDWRLSDDGKQVRFRIPVS